MTRICFILSHFLLPFLVTAQYKTVPVNMLWFNYNNYININRQWSINNDVQFRTRDWANERSQSAVRTAVVYNINTKFAVSCGLAWFGTVRNVNGHKLTPHEWRPWQEVAYQQEFKKINFSQRLRTEQRFFQQVVNGEKTSGYECTFRVRYRFEFGFPCKNGKLDFHIGNEVMVNPGDICNNQFFDQNRVFVLVNYKISKPFTLQWQFIKLQQWRPSVNTMEDQNVFRFSIHHRINLKDAVE